MKKIILVMLFCGLSALCVNAQTPVYGTKSQQSKTVAMAAATKENRWSFGGNLGAVFGDYTAISVAPQVGYMFNRYFTAGVGITYSYQYQKVDYPSYTNKYNYSYIGVNAYGRVTPIPYIFAQVQPEIYYTWGNQTVNGAKSNIDKTTVPTLLVGGGVNIPMGNNASFTVMLQYDVIQDENSPYADNQLIYTVGVNVHF